MKRPRLKPGQTIGPWQLEEWLGSGGNAEVWRARQADQLVALKVLLQRNVTSEPFERFRREVEFQTTLGTRPGILPVLESWLPKALGKDERAWLAMPEATPARVALEGEPLEVLVHACMCWATTLAELAAEHGVAHRDIKPGNLYAYNDGWCLGDFGLVELPEAEALTAEGDSIGPLYFLAPEVLLRRENIDYQAADVWSLAKTLWVLAAGQQWPLPIEHRTDLNGLRVADLRPHPRALLIDRVLERCTTIEPTRRLTMRELANELRTWASMEPDPARPSFDLSELGAKLRQRLAKETDSRSTLERLHELTQDHRDALQARLEPLHLQMEANYDAVEIAVYDQLNDNILGSMDAAGLPEILWAESAVDRILTGPDFNRFVFQVGWIVELLSPSTIRVAGVVGFGWTETTGWEQSPVIEQVAPVGTLQAEQAISAFADELLALVPDWLSRFIERLPQG